MKKLIAAILIAVLAAGALSVFANAEAKGPMNWRNFGRNQDHGFGHGNENGNAPVLQNFVRVNAVATDWGTAKVNGTIQAQSRTLVLNVDEMRQGVSATAMWTTNTSRHITGDDENEDLSEQEFEHGAKVNSTFTFYTAKLVEANVSSLNEGTNDFFINGTWNVYNVTNTFEVITEGGNIVSFHRNTEAKVLATKAYGEFNVTTGWTKFTLDIEYRDASILSGLVTRQRTSSTQCSAFKILDDNVATFTKADLRELAKAYGATPGWGNYDQRMDYNFDYKIDITDLTTAAANVNV
jgi:hypothetical protein